MDKSATRNKARWAARVAGAGIGVLGLTLATAVPSGTTASAAGSSNVSAAATRSATVQTSNQAQAASSNALSAARYGWGKVVAGDEFNYRGSPDRRKWRVYSSAGH